MTRPNVYAALCVHWDHHPVGASQCYGAGTDPEQIRRYLQAVRPDVTQYHTIGCKGYVNYPSRIAPPVPGLVGDPAGAWARVCAEMGIPFGCYAASFACGSPEPHPEWRCINRAGIRSEQDYCPNSRWTEEFFIPLLREIMERYRPAHVWLDGVWLPDRREDCCFCEHCQARFQKEYGRPLPRKPSAADWPVIQEFHESSLDQAIGRIGRAIKHRDPHVRLACNSTYFFKDLRAPSIEVDWLSWDALNTPDLHRASFEATYLNTAGKPADIMIYDHGIVRWQPRLVRRPRTAAQFAVEAGILLAHGCRVNLWHDPLPDGAITETQVTTGHAVASFVRERQDWCIGNDSLAEVAILASRQDHLADPARQAGATKAMHQILQEAHIPCDIVREDTLMDRLKQYHMIVLPEVRQLDIDTAQWLQQFTLDGGNILIVAAQADPHGANWLEALLGPHATFAPAPAAESAPDVEVVDWDCVDVEVGHRRFALKGDWQPLIRYAASPNPWLARLTAGEGSVLAIAGEALSDYAETRWPTLRDLIASAVRQGIGEAPLVELNSTPGVELTVNRRDNDVYVHLVNLTPGTCSGTPSEVFFDALATHANLTLVVRPPHVPTHVIAMPGDTPLRFRVDGSAVHITVPELRDHIALRLIGANSE